MSFDPDRSGISLHKVEIWVLRFQLDPDLFGGGDLDGLLVTFAALPPLGARALPLGAASLLLPDALDILLLLR